MGDFDISKKDQINEIYSFDDFSHGIINFFTFMLEELYFLSRDGC
mgnify:FL=1